ncbi:putative membrane protein YfcA [Povalibacter uvarum]|uniref:Probable membrane transporter protein n=1 Tax=Povalibacter uvarum TaxID=732238 RepID=A0A841HGB6_9GAMM|nr:sulfite exporter TauE/SafE family protein [Povalibacter uvarum]MBB6091816.1 putative membrane protein YfcA [Povalibacter uvarum]
MTATAQILLSVLVVLAAYFAWRWWRAANASMRQGEPAKPGLLRVAIGFVTNFFDTLGIGSFAPTTSVFKFLRVVPDELIPGTLNVGHVIPTVAQALIFIAVVDVDPTTLTGMIASAVLGAWLGAGIVSKLPRRAIQISMGFALLVAATLFLMSNLELLPRGGEAIGLTGVNLAIAIAINFVLGALMTLGIGLYAPCLILVSLLGMNPITAFPIMMGSCGFLMPVAGVRFVGCNRYDLRAALGLLIGGVPAVLLAAFVVKQLPLVWLRWLVVFVTLYAAALMLRAAFARRAD